jgi:hypothetical protein
MATQKPTFAKALEYQVWTCAEVPNVTVHLHVSHWAGKRTEHFAVNDHGINLQKMSFRTLRGALRAAGNLAKEYMAEAARG